MRRFLFRALILPATAATLTACVGMAGAVETWVGADGEIRVVPGTEDPAPPPRFLPDAPRPTHAGHPVPPPSAKTKTLKPPHRVAIKPAKPVVGAVDRRATGSITPTNPPTSRNPQNTKPIDPNAANQPAQQPPPPPPRPAPPITPPPVIDPGNAIITVDPSGDTAVKTREEGDAGIDPGGDPLAAPGALPTNPIDPTLESTQSPTGQGSLNRTATTNSQGGGPLVGSRQAQPIGAAASRPTAAVNAPVGPLQPLAPSTTGSVAVAPQPAITPNPRSTLDDPLTDPQATAYDQRGVRINSFTWRPAIEASVGATSNIQASAGGTPSSALRLAPELIGQSDWSRHQLGVDIHGSFTEFPQDGALYRPTVSATVNGRIDFSEDTQLALKTSYGLDKLPGTSALSAAGSTAAGLQQTVAASAGLTRDIGRFALTLRGEVDRTDYQLNAQQAAITSAAGLDNTDLITALRGTYNLTAGVKPFVEVQVDARRYDGLSQDTTTSVPTSHDSTGAAAKTGVTLDLGPILTGEASTGYGYETPTNHALLTLRGWTVDENLIWSPTRLTRVTFSTVSAIEPSLIAGASGAVSRTFGVKIADDIFRNLTVELGGSFLERNYTGVYRTENLDELTSSLTWKINPTLQTFVRGTYDAFSSSAHTDDYRAATIYAGVRLQK